MEAVDPKLNKDFGDLQADVEKVVQSIKLWTIKGRKALKADDGNGMSNAYTELSIANVRLGDRLADADGIARAADNGYHAVREHYKVEQVKKKKIAAGVADSMKMYHDGYIEAFAFYNEAQVFADRLRYLRKSTDKTIDSLRSRVSFMRDDRKNS